MKKFKCMVSHSYQVVREEIGKGNAGKTTEGRCKETDRADSGFS